MSKMTEGDCIHLAAQVGDILTRRELSIATAESCTGGLLGHILTGVPGSSRYFIGGIIAYSNRIKEQILGVDSNTLLRYGAVSEQTAAEMAAGIANKFDTSIGLSTTGIAGPTGGTPEKPIGLVWIGIHMEGTQAFECHFKGGRAAVKLNAVGEILTKLLDILKISNDYKR
jgi:PncC family amidohydrolase